MNNFSPHKKVNAAPAWCSLLLFFLCLPLFSFSQQLTLSRQLAPKEISKNAAHTILQDSYGFIWLGGTGLFKYDGYVSKAYKTIANDSLSGGLGDIRDLLEDQKGNIWIGSSNGLFRYERETDQLQRLFSDQLTNQFGKTSKIWCLYEDSAGRIWVGGEVRLFVISNPEAGEVHVVQGLDIGPSNWFKGGIMSICEDDRGHIFTASINGLWEVGKELSVTRHLPEGFGRSSIEFRIKDAAWGQGDTLWLATPEGLWIFETETGSFTEMAMPGYDRKLVGALLTDDQHQLWIATKDEIFQRCSAGRFKKVAGDAHYLYDGIEVLYKERNGNLWIGGNHGVGMMDFNEDKKLPFYQIGGGSPYHDNHFYRINQDSAGGFWFRMYRAGLGYCPEMDGPFEILLQPTVHYFGEEIKDICTDADANVWVITYTNGLFFFEKGKKQYRPIDLGDSLRRIAIPSALLADNQDNRLLWFSSRAGLCSVDRFTFERKWYHPRDDLPWLDLDAIGMMGQADDGNLWFRLLAGGNQIVGYFDRKKEKFVAEPHLSGRPETTQIYQFKQVAEHEMWVATNTGMIIVDTERKTQRFWMEENGFPTNNPLSITPDGRGNIWFTSGRKIYKYDGQHFEDYNANEAIERFDNTCAALTREGLVAFGGVNGLHVFDPEKIEKDTIRPKVYLTGIRVFNKIRKLGQAHELVKEITLPYADNVFTFEFSGLHYAHSKSIRYRRKLEGFEKDWVEIGSDERRTTYTNLSPGDYTFKVLAANADGFWTAEEEGLNIVITILPPWYRSWWAYIIWASIVLGSLYFFYKFQLNRRLAEAEAHHFKELDHAKSRLYTNITHEFRTPLTVILGMVEQVKNDPKNWYNEGLQLIRRNGKQLLHLVNQLLDLSKLESGHLPLRLVQADVVSFLQYLTESFHSYADSKDIRLHFRSDFPELHMDHDPEKLQQVITNLLSNAIKFTPAGGDVYVDVRMEPARGSSPSGARGAGSGSPSGAGHLLLQVSDNGSGIASEHLPHIFDRFYQADTSSTRRGEGTGIGLALAQEMVRLMDGTIEVESKLGKGTRFFIRLPVTRTAGKVNEHKKEEISDGLVATILPEAVRSTGIPAVRPRDGNTVLLVEDNPDVITFLASVLNSHYRIETAQDGQEGVDKALELVPDIIVSDVMMPGKDGFELCRELKTDERTSHIPIILLTAKADQPSKVEGLRYGADAYLTKPFHREELLVRLEKLIELRRHLQERFLQPGGLLTMLQTESQSVDDLFLQKVIGIIGERLDDENFGMPQLCKALHMTRTTLFRKLKALTGKSATNLIRSVRLEKARELLATSEQRITEVCFAVGFNSPGYFSRVFKEEFGVAPRDVRK